MDQPSCGVRPLRAPGCARIVNQSNAVPAPGLAALNDSARTPASGRNHQCLHGAARSTAAQGVPAFSTGLLPAFRPVMKGVRAFGLRAPCTARPSKAAVATRWRHLLIGNRWDRRGSGNAQPGPVATRWRHLLIGNASSATSRRGTRISSPLVGDTY